MEIKKRTKEPNLRLLKPDRRTFGKAVLAGFLGGPAVLSSVSLKAQASSDIATSRTARGMKLALMLDSRNKERWVLARQIGVNHAVVPVSQVLIQVLSSPTLAGWTPVINVLVGCILVSWTLVRCVLIGWALVG